MKKALKRTIEGMLIGTLIFGNIKNSYAPEQNKKHKQEILEHIKNYENKLEKRDSLIQNYSKKAGISLEKKINEKLEKIKPHELIDESYVLATIRQESVFNPKAKSYVGARGLMQIMPNTWKDFEKESNYWKSCYNPEKNLEVGIKILDNYAKFCEKNNPNWEKLEKQEKIKLVSAAYNGGNNRLKSRNWEIEKMPKETIKYVPEILKYYKKFNVTQ